MVKKKESTKKTTNTTTKKSNIFSSFKSRQTQTIVGFFLILFGLFLCIAFISFFFSWQEDQSTLEYLTDKTIKSKNLLGKIGANLSHFFIYDGFGLAAFIIAFQLFLSGFYILAKKRFSEIIISWNWNMAAMLWLSLAFGFLNHKYALLSGVIGFEINNYLQNFIGKTGLVIALIFLLITYAVLRYKVNIDAFIEKMKQRKAEREAEKETQKLQDLENTKLQESTKKTVQETKSSVIDKQNATKLPAADPRPGPTGILIDFP